VPSWGEILAELQATIPQPGAPPDWDGVRRKYLVALHRLTRRPLIAYETDWLGGGPPMAGITLEDMQAMMEVCRGLEGPELDLILHSPGGSAEATASIVHYLRQKFADIRVFVPIAAMSAATMWALAGNRIVMGKHSQLGPIDPQLVTAQGNIPARAILDQFDRAKRECSQDPAALGAWAPILQQYGPALIEQCENAEELAMRLVREWLAAYMFAGEGDPAAKAQRVAEYFAAHRLHQSHQLGIHRDAARERGVIIDDLEEDERLQDAVLSVHHACVHTLQSSAVKIVENHLGRGFFQHAQAVQVQMPAVMPPVPTATPQPPS
jgi:hypothetical protein